VCSTTTAGSTSAPSNNYVSPRLGAFDSIDRLRTKTTASHAPDIPFPFVSVGSEPLPRSRALPRGLAA
jgi:hypothetical protein